MHWSVSPLAGKTTDWRAVCGKFASPVRREGASKPIDASYPYHVFPPCFSEQGVDGRDKPGHDSGEVVQRDRNPL